MGGFGAEPGQVQGFRRRFPRRCGRLAWVQRPLRFNRGPDRVLEKVSEKVPGGFGAEPGQVQQGSGESSGEGLGAFGAAR